MTNTNLRLKRYQKVGTKSLGDGFRTRFLDVFQTDISINCWIKVK